MTPLVSFRKESGLVELPGIFADMAFRIAPGFNTKN